MNTNFFLPIGPAGLLAGAMILGAGFTARAADKAESDAFPNFESYIKITGQAAAISGNEAAFQSRTKQPSDGGVGIEDLHVSKDVSKDTTLVIDGKAITGSEDYLAHFNVSKNEVGSIDAGYKRFRTFYDGAGAFFPLSKQWMPLANEDLHVDRAKFWVEGKLAIKDAPEFTVRYTNELRDGRKDSTIWGSSDFTGLPFTVAPNPVSEVRKGSPSYLNLGERNERLELAMKQTIKKTEIEFRLFAERTNNNDTRYVTNFPGEVIPWSIAGLATAAQPAAKAAVSAANWNNQAMIAENDAQKTQTQGATFESITPLTDKLTFKAGASYELVHSTIGGGRPIVTQIATATGIVPVATDNYAGLYGGSRVKDYTGNVSLDYKPTKNWFMKLAFRDQSEFIRGTSGYNVLAASGTPAIVVASTPRIGWAKLHQSVRTPAAEVRYTGFKNLSLYATASKRELTGVESNTSSYNPLTATIGTPAANNVSEGHGDYTVGANWKASQKITLRAETFRKAHKDDSVGFATTPATIVGDYYLLDSTHEGYKLTATVKATPTLGFTTRFISDHSRMQVTGFLSTYPAYDSLNGRNHMLCESIDWNPSPRVYCQLNGTVTYNVISTIYPRAGYTPATATTNAFDSNKIVQNSDNNYVTGSFISGFVVDKKTDAEAQVTYYRANDGNALLAPLTQPYGVAVKDTTITLGVKHKFSDTWVGHAKAGYFDSVNDTTGGNTNYHGPVGYVSLERSL